MTSWIKNEYGSKRGAVRRYQHNLLSLLGKYHAYHQIDWTSIDRLVFICKGNICRSAYAEAFAKSIGIEAISCGIDTTAGNSANSVAIEIAAQRGLDLDQHRTTPISELKFEETDLLLAMEPWQAESLANHFNGSHNCSLLGLWGKPNRSYIHDPYGSSSTYFNNCFNYIESAIHEVASKIKTSKL